MYQVNYLRGAVLVGDADSPTAWHHPQEILVADLEPPSIGQINRKWLERRLLSSFSDSPCRHTQIITELTTKVQLCQIRAE